MPIILHHHERFAGHGYPYGLRANEIPLGARIVAIADAYDAMTHDRPYKRAMSHDAAIVELKQHAGTQFDPELVALFCDLYTEVAPTPDPTVLAITHPPEKVIVRRERRVRAVESETTTQAATRRDRGDRSGARRRPSDGDGTAGEPPDERDRLGARRRRGAPDKCDVHHGISGG